MTSNKQKVVSPITIFNYFKAKCDGKVYFVLVLSFVRVFYCFAFFI